ncbi:hypothetical protein CC86DRAFT_278769, partial [Ophiobolus disseminans]
MRSVLLLVLGALSFVHSQSTSTSGRCGSQFNGLTCKGSTFGDCCSKYNYCGKTADHCGTGCQAGYGTCTSSSPPAVAKVSTDGTCGGSKGFTCQGSVFGNCCSKNGWCGKTSAYCGTGCMSKFGSSSSTSPSSSQQVSTNARCGYEYDAKPGGMTCLGSKWGNCCSQFSYCGSTDAYCGKGCQDKYGNC